MEDNNWITIGLNGKIRYHFLGNCNVLGAPLNQSKEENMRGTTYTGSVCLVGIGKMYQQRAEIGQSPDPEWRMGTAPHCTGRPTEPSERRQHERG